MGQEPALQRQAWLLPQGAPESPRDSRSYRQVAGLEEARVPEIPASSGKFGERSKF